MKPVGLWAATPAIKGPIKVGYQAVLSGTLAGYGEFHKMGALMAVEEINAAGGIAGNKIEMEFRDSTLAAPAAIQNARYFVDSWGADFLAGVDSSGQALALAPVMAELDRILMVTHAATEKLTEEEVFKKGIKQVFRICYSDLSGWQCGSVRGKGSTGHDLGHNQPEIRIRVCNLEDVPGDTRQTETGSQVCR